LLNRISDVLYLFLKPNRQRRREMRKPLHKLAVLLAGAAASCAAPAFAAETITYTYDAHGRLKKVERSQLLRRHVHGPNMDEPLVTYEGAGLSNRRFLHADERGSIVAISDNAGNPIAAFNAYDEYGVPQGQGQVGVVGGRFGYTGQAWLPEVKLHYYKARMYDAKLPRFLQPDPIGYIAGMNLYAYVKGDPVNLIDPKGLAGVQPGGEVWCVTDSGFGYKCGESLGDLKRNEFEYTSAIEIYIGALIGGVEQLRNEVRDLLSCSHEVDLEEASRDAVSQDLLVSGTSATTRGMTQERPSPFNNFGSGIALGWFGGVGKSIGAQCAGGGSGARER
jgi:RHS repeat-associated protein